MPLFRRQSAAVLPSLAPHDSKARLIVVTTRRDSWRSHVHRTYIAQRVQLFKLQTRNVGGRGALPSPFSGGFKGGILFGKRIPPLVPPPARRIFPPRSARKATAPPRERKKEAALWPTPHKKTCAVKGKFCTDSFVAPSCHASACPHRRDSAPHKICSFSVQSSFANEFLR